ISRKDGIYPDAMVPSPIPRIILAAYQESPPTPVRPDNQPRTWRPRPVPYPSDYSKQVYRYIAGNSLIVTSAPVLDDPTKVPTTGDFDELALEPCNAWPACLGATGHVLTVAAVDAVGTGVTNEPGTGEPYDLNEKF